MARKTVKSPGKPKTANPKAEKTTAARPAKAPIRWVLRWVVRGVLGLVCFGVLWILAHSIINPTITPYMISEKRRLGDIDKLWVDADNVAPIMLRAVVAAEDANFCNHWGFDMNAIRAALNSGGNRGASTLTQQVVKNVFLWHGRSWSRKALEAMITPVVELTWSKRRILEVYLNVAEFDEGVFGVEAASHHYFGVGPARLSDVQAARLAMVLPAPQFRSASRPTDEQRRRTAQILDGARTIAADGRSACFED